MTFDWGAAGRGALQGASTGAMTGNPYAAIALALGSAASAGFSAKKKNKGLPSAPGFQPYSGLRPQRINFPAEEAQYRTGNIFRPVQQQISDILMRRSLGQDVGFDPRRLQELKQNYDILANEVNQQKQADIVNELSGIGQSRNLGARDILLGRSKRQAELDRQRYFNTYDIEDLAQREAEKREATQNLQRLNEFNFGQENEAANFDLRSYLGEAEVGSNAYQNALLRYGQKDNPLGEAVNTGFTTFGALERNKRSNAYIDLLRQMARGEGQQGQQPTFGSTQNTGYYPGVMNLKKRFSTQYL